MPVIEKTASPEAMLEKENLAYLGEADAKKESTFTPKIVAFCCNWCSYAGADLAGNNRADYPADIKIIRVPCSGRVNPLFIMRAFEKGADGVIICGCHPGDCHYTTGNYYTRRSEGARFASIMNEFADTIKNLGRNVRLEDIRCRN